MTADPVVSLQSALHATAVEWLAARLADPRWRAWPGAAGQAVAVLELLDRFTVAARGNTRLPGTGARWSSAQVAERTGMPLRTVTYAMGTGRWPSARRVAGRWTVDPTDLEEHAPMTQTPARFWPAPYDAPDRQLAAVLEAAGGTPAERRTHLEAWRAHRAHAARTRGSQP